MNSRQNDEHTNAGGHESVLTEVCTNTNRLHIITMAYRSVFDSIEYTDLQNFSYTRNKSEKFYAVGRAFKGWQAI